MRTPPALLLTGLGCLALWAASALIPVEVARSESFSEGPVFDRAGNLFFSHKQGITKVAPDGSASIWIEDASGANYHGHRIVSDGTHLVCAAGLGKVLRLAPDGEIIEVVSGESEGKPLRAPNDLTLDDHDGFYFTDPGGSRAEPIGTVHYVDRAGSTKLAATGMQVPNGLVLSLDGRTLYVAETQLNRIVRFTVTQPGVLGPLEEFARLPSREGHQAEPDGLTIDTDGNIYVAHLGMSAVQVLSPEGKLVRTLPAGNYDASNLVFGGPLLNQLYITGSTGHRAKSPGRLFRLDLDGVRGVSPLRPGGARTSPQ